MPKPKHGREPPAEMVRKAKEIRSEWIIATGRDEKDLNVENLYICSCHFSRECYDTFVKLKHGSFKTAPGRILKEDAVPTLNLPKRKSSPLTARSKRQKVKERKEVVKNAINRYINYIIKLSCITKFLFKISLYY